MPNSSTTDKRGIKFDATINLGHILTFVGFLATGVGVWSQMDKRVTVLEEARVMQVKLDDRQDADRTEMKKQMREDIKEISAKLDRALEILSRRS